LGKIISYRIYYFTLPALLTTIFLPWGDHYIERDRDWYERVSEACTKVGYITATDKSLDVLKEMKAVVGVEPNVDCFTRASFKKGVEKQSGTAVP
jgi:hypothetical protein